MDPSSKQHDSQKCPCALEELREKIRAIRHFFSRGSRNCYRKKATQTLFFLSGNFRQQNLLFCPLIFTIIIKHHLLCSTAAAVFQQQERKSWLLPGGDAAENPSDSSRHLRQDMNKATDAEEQKPCICNSQCDIRANKTHVSTAL